MGTPSDSEIGAGPRWSLRLFGGFELRTRPADERVALPGKRERLLLAYLALARGGRQTRAKLAVLLWGDGANGAAADNLRTCLWSLRKALGDHEHRVLASDADDIVLDASRFDVDAVAFERLSSHSSRSELEAAAGLYAGDLLDGLDIDSEEFEAWRRVEAQRYREQGASVLHRLLVALAEAGETERAISTGERLLRLEPLHEAAARRLMQLYRDAGRRGAARDHYRALAETLRVELDTEPEPETRAVFAEIARGADGARADVRAPGSATPERGSAGAAVDSAAAMPPRVEATPRWRWTSPLVFAALILVAGITALGLSYQRGGGPSSSVAPDARAAEVRATDAISIAVLPFSNLSGDPSQEFFSDGMTEEVTVALAKVPGWRVVARTSAFQFKGAGHDARGVGRSLGASHLVEGSVRRDGTRVRINAQLIEAHSGTDLWADSYEREFDDMFAIQDDIARAIAEALKIPLGLESDRDLHSTRIGDLDSYQSFLRARAMVHARGYGSLAEGQRLLKQVVASDPDYAPAWATLAQAYIFALNYHPAWLSGDFETLRPLVEDLMPKAEAASQRAVDLDPKLADGYAIRGLTFELRGELARAEDLYQRAMALDPTNPDVLHFYSRLLAEVGRLEEAQAMREQLRALDPFVPVYNWVTSWIWWINGETDEAVTLSDALPPADRGYLAPRLLAAVGRYSEAADLVASNPPGMFLPGVTESAEALLRSAPMQVASSDALPRLGWLNFVYVHVGALDRTLEFYEGGVDVGYSVSISNALLWLPYYAELRKTERYKDFMRKRGVVAYWRERRWPARCRPQGEDDFTCN